jgi:hypothetical protein
MLCALFRHQDFVKRYPTLVAILYRGERTTLQGSIPRNKYRCPKVKPPVTHCV